jgi:hypothetical protein
MELSFMRVALRKDWKMRRTYDEVLEERVCRKRCLEKGARKDWIRRTRALVTTERRLPALVQCYASRK